MRPNIDWLANVIVVDEPPKDLLAFYRAVRNAAPGYLAYVVSLEQVLRPLAALEPSAGTLGEEMAAGFLRAIHTAKKFFGT